MKRESTAWVERQARVRHDLFLYGNAFVAAVTGQADREESTGKPERVETTRERQEDRASRVTGEHRSA